MTTTLPRLSAATAERLLQSSVVAPRSRWAVLKASGPTVRDYLQGQVTQDLEKLTPGQGIHACLLTPQGKAASELYILEGNRDELILLTPGSHAVATVSRLRQFALGHEIRIGVVDDLAICSIQGANAAATINDFDLPEPENGWLACSRKSSEDTFALVMPESPRGFWIISSREKIDKALGSYEPVNEDEFEAMRIIRGFPDFGTEWDESMHPLNANLIEFNGVSFEKGCYVGQEVTARMNWRGGIKKKLYRVSIDGRPDSFPCPIQSTVKIGELKSAAIDHENCCFGIALLPIEVAEAGAPLSLENDVTVTILEACHA
ncbi:folate-binding protein YgfZ [Mariprofundus aestuarium]|uniref:Folate-binding protein YgfZ n=1 Tax=Mariprofundus aestuarium TaxID=1921086 RepID=A0A2K8KZL6_MARES|nr:folate-binding protein YgfZ [Mariprofundus aestuarium]ATX78981.1 folate-binding protein YgfZ [Mariprofundus aestuarium]